MQSHNFSNFTAEKFIIFVERTCSALLVILNNIFFYYYCFLLDVRIILNQGQIFVTMVVFTSGGNILWLNFSSNI